MSLENRQKMKGRVPWNKGKTGVYSPEFLQEMSDSRKGKLNPWPEEAKTSFRQKMSGHKFNVGRHPSEETREKLSQANKGKQNTLGHKLTAEHIEKIRQNSKRAWQDPESKLGTVEWFKKILAGTHLRPNKPERLLINILESNLPGEFAYNGDYSQGVILNRMCPDFININGEKCVIEVFGEAFHDPEKAWKPISWKSTEQGRLELYGKVGFKCLIIWEKELKEPAKVLIKIRQFMSVLRDGQ